MSRIGRGIFIGVLVLLMGTAAWGTSLMERLKASYSEIHSIQADFVQETTVGVRRRMTYTGRVYIVPGKSMWEYKTPQPQIVWTNGDLFVLYDPVNREAVKGQLDKEAIVTKGPFFSLIDQIKRYYTVKEGGKGQSTLTLTPVDTHGPIQKVIVYLDPKSLLIKKVETLDSLGNLNAVSFRHIKVNAAIPSKTFEIILPPDVRISQP